MNNIRYDNETIIANIYWIIFNTCRIQDVRYSTNLVTNDLPRRHYFISNFPIIHWIEKLRFEHWSLVPKSTGLMSGYSSMSPQWNTIFDFAVPKHFIHADSNQNDVFSKFLWRRGCWITPVVPRIYSWLFSGLTPECVQRFLLMGLGGPYEMVGIKFPSLASSKTSTLSSVLIFWP